MNLEPGTREVPFWRKEQITASKYSCRRDRTEAPFRCSCLLSPLSDALPLTEAYSVIPAEAAAACQFARRDGFFGTCGRVHRKSGIEYEYVHTLVGNVVSSSTYLTVWPSDPLKGGHTLVNLTLRRRTARRVQLQPRVRGPALNTVATEDLGARASLPSFR